MESQERLERSGGREVSKKGPKTRLGCVTCKARRVKCDETKPACLRCLKFWGHCEGYPSTLPTIRRRRKQTAPKRRYVLPILPRLGYTEIGAVPLLHSLTDERSFTTEKEYRYFTFFKTSTVFELPGVFGGDLWDRIILQACHQEEFVRDAAIAIGALSSCGREFVTAVKDSTGKITGSCHYRFALAQYGRAIRKMREKLIEGRGGLRVALIACLLVVCFEGLQGNFFQALEHAVSGGQLLREWIDTHEYRRKEEEGIFSPKEIEIEDEIVNAFGRLDLQIMSYVDPRPLEVHRRLMDEGIETVLNMPDNFDSVKEARSYWELVNRRASHFIAVVAAESVETENPIPAAWVDVDAGEGVDSYPINYHAEEDMYKSPPIHLLSGARDEYSLYSAEIKRWFTAFTLFYESLPRHTRAWTAASLLHIHAKTTEIMLLSSLFKDECSLDKFLPDFRDIVALSREILLDPLFRTQVAFTFDQGLVNPLRLVGRWCRDGGVRREAIRILKKSAMREGLYDGLIMAKTQEWLMNIEEEGLEVGQFIPEERRAKILGVQIDCFRKIATVKACRLGPDKDERTNIIEWGVGGCGRDEGTTVIAREKGSLRCFAQCLRRQDVSFKSCICSTQRAVIRKFVCPLWDNSFGLLCSCSSVFKRLDTERSILSDSK